jgi:hypothetical protein
MGNGFPLKNTTIDLLHLTFGMSDISVKVIQAYNEFCGCFDQLLMRGTSPLQECFCLINVVFNCIN